MEYPLPFRHLDSDQIDPQIWMGRHRPTVVNRPDSVARGDVDPDSKSALVEIGATIGLFGRCPQHRHHRVAMQHDHADVRSTLEAHRR